MGQFTYNNIHSSTYGVEYLEDASQRWFEDADWTIYDEDVSWKNGGYCYGSKVKPKTFTMKCLCEEITVQQKENIRKWFGRNTSGKLIFDDMPFVYWNVRPVKPIEGNWYNDNGKYTGVFTVTLRAYEPFGYLTRKSNTGTENDDANDYCDLILTSEMPAAPTTSSVTFDVYNPGREACGLSLVLTGSTDNPIEFLNETNGTRCIISDLPTNNLYLDINGDTGVITVYTSPTAPEYDYGYAYHDRGYVRLDPGINHIRILEQNSGGTWGAISTLVLTSISIDYNPRVLS